MDYLPKNKIKQLVAENKIKEAIDAILEITFRLNISDLYNETLLQSSHFENYKKKERVGLLESKDIEISRSKVNNSLLEIIDKIPNNQFVAPKVKNSRNKEITLLIDQPFNNFKTKEQEKLIEAIKVLLKIEANITVKRVEKGSVLFTIELPEEKAEELRQLIKKGELIEHKVVKVIAPNKSSEHHQNIIIRYWKWLFMFLFIIIGSIAGIIYFNQSKVQNTNSKSTLVDISSELIKQRLVDFPFNTSGVVSEEEAIRMLLFLGIEKEDIEIYPDFLVGELNSTIEITIWVGSYGRINTYGIRHGNHDREYFGSNETYFEINKD